MFISCHQKQFFPIKIQELWSELKREFTAEQNCFKIFFKWASF